VNAEQKKTVKQALDEIASAKAGLEQVRDELQEDFDDLSEKAQEGDRGQKMQEEIEQIEEVISNLETAEESVPG